MTKEEEEEIRLEYDDDQLDVVDKINTLLEPIGVKIKDDGKEHDVYLLVVLERIEYDK